MALPPVAEGASPEQVVSLLKALQRCPLLDGRLVKNVSLTTTASRVNHGLGRLPVGYIVVERNANSVVRSSAAHDRTALNLVASATVTVDLWVF